MENKGTSLFDKLINKSGCKGMEQENMIVAKNISLLDLWNDYVEANKRLFKLKEEEINVITESEDVYKTMGHF